jgi:hypothetical protein
MDRARLRTAASLFADRTVELVRAGGGVSGMHIDEHNPSLVQSCEELDYAETKRPLDRFADSWGRLSCSLMLLEFIPMRLSRR